MKWRSGWTSPARRTSKSSRSQRAVEEVQPVLAPEALAVEHVGRRAEDAEALCLFAVLAVKRLHPLAHLGFLQFLARHAVLVGDRDAHLCIRRIALLGP